MYLRRGQSMVEYAVLLCIILAALLIMSVYIKRAYQGRLKQEADKLGPQYSPRHTHMLMETTRDLYSVSFTGGQTDDTGLPVGLQEIVRDGINVPDGMTVTYTDESTDFSRREAVDSYTTEE
jgi:Flp pilus assembly pilin Flp